MIDWAIAIDPGDKHVGYAWWTGDAFFAAELNNAEAVLRLESDIVGLGGMRPGRGAVIIEEFRLYGGKTLGSQVGKVMHTSELIGAMKHVCKAYDVDVVEQSASIKIPTRKQLKARRIELLGTSGHAKDAQLHLYYFLLRKGYTKRLRPPDTQRKVMTIDVSMLSC